ncbi:MAG: xanthine dehydrogenase family protein subunit M, partial [Hyphomicrobiaceae bacterium]
TCDASIEVMGTGGRRTVGADDLLVGSMMTSLAADDLITGIRFPAWPAARKWAFLEFSRHRGDFALSGIALHYDPAADGTAKDVRIGVIGAHMRPIRLKAAECALEGNAVNKDTIAAACAAARDAIEPAEDIHASPAYRRALTATLLERGLRRAAGI